MQPSTFALVLALSISASALPVTDLPRANSDTAHLEIVREEAEQWRRITSEEAEEIAGEFHSLLPNVGGLLGKRTAGQDAGEVASGLLPRLPDVLEAAAAVVKRGTVEQDNIEVAKFLPEIPEAPRP